MKEIALAYVGSIVPDSPEFHNAAFSRAGQMYQQELLVGLKRAGLQASAIISAVPIPAFPKFPRIWVRWRKTYLPEGLRVTLLPFINVTPLKQGMIGFLTLWQLLKWGWRNRHTPFRVVYSYNLTVPPGAFTLFAARLIRAKAVVSLCDIDVPGQTVPDRLLWRLDYWLQRRLIPLFDGHIVASDAIARDFLPCRFYVRLEGGVRNEAFCRTANADRSSSEQHSPLVITAVGRLDETNGFPLLIRAFSLLEGDRHRLRIAGAGPLDEQIREADARDPRVEYLGLLSFEQVLDLYRSSDVLVNLRITRTMHTKYFFPSKMIEYLASGKPVITTCTGHVEEEFSAFTHLLREETPEALAQMIQRVGQLDLEERRQKGQRARSYVAANKTWEAQTRKVARFIVNTVLQIKREPPPGDEAARIGSSAS